MKSNGAALLKNSGSPIDLLSNVNWVKFRVVIPLILIWSQLKEDSAQMVPLMFFTFSALHAIIPLAFFFLMLSPLKKMSNVDISPVMMCKRPDDVLI